MLLNSRSRCRHCRGRCCSPPPAVLLLLLILGEAVAQRDRAVEYERARLAVGVDAEVAEALKLEALKRLVVCVRVCCMVYVACDCVSVGQNT